jgi:hypothetical protein
MPIRYLLICKELCVPHVCDSNKYIKNYAFRPYIINLLKTTFYDRRGNFLLLFHQHNEK